jgi:hypothetical protein
MDFYFDFLPMNHQIDDSTDSSWMIVDACDGVYHCEMILHRNF